jgi:hypothetical protein
VLIYFDARFAKWQAVSDALVAFARWRRDCAGYCYIRAPQGLRREIAVLCRHLDLEDAYSFADQDFTDDPGVPWFDLSARWVPPTES